MEEITPITQETIKRLERLYPQAEATGSKAEPQGGEQLDMFFAADFIPPLGRRSEGNGESYGCRYVRYLHDFAGDQGSQSQWAKDLEAELQTRKEWPQGARERVLARAVLLQAHKQPNKQVAQAFAGSALESALWATARAHAAGTGRADEAEVAAELLFLFGYWASPAPGLPSSQDIARLCAAIELFVRSARPSRTPGRVQRVRLAHKALLLLESVWRTVVGDEEKARERIGGNGGSGLARDAIRQLRAISNKHPKLAPQAQQQAAQLLPLVHPFDGHVTRARPPPTDADCRWAARPVPRAARDAVAAAHVGSVRATRSEREYGEWWRRLVRERGPPLGLTLGPAGARSSDVTINHVSAQQRSAKAQQQSSFCGITEPEDLPMLEAILDGQSVQWPSGTEPEQDLRGAYAALYRALFPLLPALSRALAQTIAGWAPAERDLPRTPSTGPPLPSATTALGVVRYPSHTPELIDSIPLPGSNVKRISRSNSQAQATVAPEVGARLLAQYAQWQAAGSLLMLVLMGLQANHVLQADYFAQLLMNENIIPAIFWWLGTCNLNLIVSLPAAIRIHTFSSSFHNQPPTTVVPWMPALSGLSHCLRALRRLTSHNGLRKGLLYKNKALYFYGRLLAVPHLPIQQIAAELVRDIMPVVSKRQKLLMLDTISQVFLLAQPSINDTHWLADYSLDPQVEMHRHVELLRLLHFYHFNSFNLRLPRDPALFPSLASQVIDLAPKLIVPPVSCEKHDASNEEIKRKNAKCRQSGAAVGEHSWLLWDSDLEDTLNDVYSPAIGT
ncbi:hypothetical protein LPJ78_002753 [Coemansia sp. RSA 989]|nr:hypothetical protein LPJ78_002753 [Coemansia sp. RSA 989]KAJ1874623.1 hypothetical protein LPJ55_001356 [Coemansia sp. RSA 990]KAJ2671150.1 hypothetical protein IWW42_003559 [Coemansia sp. RSA 1085]